MKTITLKIITLLVSILTIGIMQAQWAGTNPITTNANVNVGGLPQFGRFHIRQGSSAQLNSVANFSRNQMQNVLSLSKDIAASTSFLNPTPTVVSIPTWGLAINDLNKRLSFTYVDMINQPSTISAWGSNVFQTAYPLAREVFSINTTEVNSNVLFKSNFVSLNNLSSISGDINVNSGMSAYKDFSLYGTFRIKDQNGDNQFSIDNAGYVRAREVIVDFDIIPDYVFKEGYKLMKLDELESFITENKHLPNIKSEAEYNKAGGIGIGELNVKLLEKVEELTLYTIAQQKQIDELKKIVQEMKKK
jgi:hypothetical protein